jgi:hypothetical protein
MALFRAITAEEEAATALIFALKQRGYPGAEKLKPRDHSHKAGIAPFLRTIEAMLAELRVPTPTVQLKSEGEYPRIDLHFLSENLGLPPGSKTTPDEPLNGLLREGATGTSGEVATFDEQLRDYANDRGASGFLAAIKQEANVRNRLLYAADDGIPVARDVDRVLIARGRPVTLLLTLTVAILQTKAHQLFAVQALEAYLRALESLPADAYDYDAALGPPADIMLTVTRSAEAAPQAQLVRRMSPAVPTSDMNFQLRRPADE